MGLAVLQSHARVVRQSDWRMAVERHHDFHERHAVYRIRFGWSFRARWRAGNLRIPKRSPESGWRSNAGHLLEWRSYRYSGLLVQPRCVPAAEHRHADRAIREPRPQHRDRSRTATLGHFCDEEFPVYGI